MYEIMPNIINMKFIFELADICKHLSLVKHGIMTLCDGHAYIF